MKKIIWIFFTILVCGILTSCEQHSGKFELLNKSSTVISKVTVEICDQSFNFNNLEVGEHNVGMFEVTSDDHYKIMVVFSNNKSLSRNIGYVTNGLDFNHRIIIKDADINLEILELR